jgi:hypothetical protein
MIFAPRVISSRLNLQPTIQEKTMKTLRKLGMVVALTLMLGTYALAGTIETPPGTIETPPTPQSTPATGITETPPSTIQSASTATDPVVDIVLGLLQGALSLF